MEIIAWCIMPNHTHLIFRRVDGQHPSKLLGDFKRFTSKKTATAIMENPNESRKENLLRHFRAAAAKSSNVSAHQFWRHDNKPIELWSNKVIHKKVNYVHQNPVRAGMVSNPWEYRYSSAIDYADGKGFLEGIIPFQYLG